MVICKTQPQGRKVGPQPSNDSASAGSIQRNQISLGPSLSKSSSCQLGHPPEASSLCCFSQEAPVTTASRGLLYEPTNTVRMTGSREVSCHLPHKVTHDGWKLPVTSCSPWCAESVERHIGPMEEASYLHQKKELRTVGLNWLSSISKKFTHS